MHVQVSVIIETMPLCSYIPVYILGQYYHNVDNFQLSAEDVSLLNEDLKNALIPFEQVKITGDLGEGRGVASPIFIPSSIVT